VAPSVVERFAATTDVWYSDNAITALDIPGRVLSGVDERYGADEFRSARRLRITALIQTKLEPIGVGDSIRARFRGAGAWTETTLPGAAVNAWTTVLEPTATP
jgi:hypothetical protein